MFNATQPSLRVIDSRRHQDKNPDSVELTPIALEILGKFQASYCHYDDEDIVSELCNPYESDLLNNDFNTLFEPANKQKQHEAEKRYSEEMARIKADTNFVMEFKKQFLEGSNAHRNAMAKHAKRIWVDHQSATS